jgi:manganese transport protein
LLILSQVILSLQLGFAIIPLIHFVSDKKTMGMFAIKPFTKICAWLIASILIYLNFKMLLNEVTGIFESNNMLPKMLVITGGLIFISLLIYIIIYPLIEKRKIPASIQMHPAVEKMELDIPDYKKIAVALEFTENDKKLIAYAVGQGRENTTYLFMHIVESASAKLLGKESDDFETRSDQEQMNYYVEQMTERGLTSEGFLGFKSRAKEIVRIVKEQNADMLVVGAHRHTGFKDFVYGQTINSVRHELQIPVLVVNL